MSSDDELSSAPQDSLLDFCMKDFSVLQPYREYASRCNYCRRKNNRGRVAYGVETWRLTACDYDELLERGFIRSGGHVYLPSNNLACCPNLPIRLDSTRFQPSKQQMKSLKALRKFLLGERPITIPAYNADVFSQVIAAAKLGKASAAAEILCKHSLEEAEDDDEGNLGTTPSSPPPTRAICSYPNSVKFGDVAAVNFQELHTNLTCTDCNASGAAEQFLWNILVLSATILVLKQCIAANRIASDDSKIETLLSRIASSKLRQTGAAKGCLVAVVNLLHVCVPIDTTMETSLAEIVVPGMLDLLKSRLSLIGLDPSLCTANIDAHRLVLTTLRETHSTLLERLLQVASSLHSQVFGSGASIAARKIEPLPTAAHTRVPALLRQQYAQQQQEREIRGKAQLLADPDFPKLEDDADGLEDATTADRKFAQEQQKKISDVASAIEEYLAEGLGEQLEWLRHRGMSVEQEERDAVRSAEFAVPGARMPNLSELLAPNPDVADKHLLPFGAGPVALTVTLVRAHYSTEAHELYERFNLSLHRGLPKKNSKRAFMRHLVQSPITNCNSDAVGSLYLLATGRYREDYDPLAVRVDTSCPVVIILHQLATNLVEDCLLPSDMVAAELARFALFDPQVAWVLQVVTAHLSPQIVNGAQLKSHRFSFSSMPPIMRGLGILVSRSAAVATSAGFSLMAVILAIFMLQDDIIREARNASAVPPDSTASGADTVHEGAATSNDSQSAAKRPRMVGGGLPFGFWSSHELLTRLSKLIDRHTGLFLWLDDAVQQQLLNSAHLVNTYASRPAPGWDKSSQLDEYIRSSDAGGAGCVSVDGWDLSMGFGTFFHEYRLDDELVAVSVLDILPTRVASVYFFYNPDFRYLELGKISALVEIWLTRQLFAHTAAHPQVLGLPEGTGALCKHWDANFYVHTCTAMNYKRYFVPSEVLCPWLHNQQWVELSADVLRKLDADPGAILGKVVVARDDGSTVESSSKEDVEMYCAERLVQTAEEAEAVLPRLSITLTGGRVAPYMDLTAHSQALLKPGLLRFMRAIGPDFAARILIDPNWICSIEAQLKREREARDARSVAATVSAESSQQ